jgi:hypothetical protein
MASLQLAQSEKADSVPFMTVSTDDRKSTCWVVVGYGKAVRCYNGVEALAMLQMMCASKGIPTP